ncbi:MAG: hypothetical protein HQ525_07775, partial [Anaerolineae bacterium]|nr:hypothetical protein [Anaerolineae bacterium]
DPKEKSDSAAQVLPLIDDLPNPIERETFRQQLARMLKVDERALIGGQAQGKRVRRIPSSKRKVVKDQEVQQSTTGIAAVNPARKIEEYCLGILIRNPNLLYRLDRALQESGLHALSLEDFEYTENQTLFRAVKASLEQDELEAYDHISANLPEALAELKKKLLAETEELSPVEERLLEEALRGVIKLRRLGLNESLNQLRFFQEEAQQKGDLEENSYQKLVMQHALMLRTLDEAQRRLSLRRLE